MATDFKIAQPLHFYERFLQENVRPDGRSLKEFRKALLNIDSIETSEGSAMVKLGDTVVLCGIKAEVADPPLGASKTGYIVSNVELPPLCSPKFRPGPPSDQSQVLSQFLNDTIKNSEMINLESLCIAEGRAVWCLFADVICLNYDGSIQDASLIALLAALHNCRLPKLAWNDEKGEVCASDGMSALTITGNPIASTFAVFQNSQLIADPNDEEEELAASVVTIVTLDDGKICSISKPGGLSIDEAILRQCVEMALLRGGGMRSLIEAVTTSIDR